MAIHRLGLELARNTALKPCTAIKRIAIIPVDEWHMHDASGYYYHYYWADRKLIGPGAIVVVQSKIVTYGII